MELVSYYEVRNPRRASWICILKQVNDGNDSIGQEAQLNIMVNSLHFKHIMNISFFRELHPSVVTVDAKDLEQYLIDNVCVPY